MTMEQLDISPHGKRLTKRLDTKDPMITLTLDQNEQNILVQLLDIATKASGLNGAEASIYFVNKIKQAQPKETPTPPIAASQERNKEKK